MKTRREMIGNIVKATAFGVLLSTASFSAPALATPRNDHLIRLARGIADASKRSSVSSIEGQINDLLGYVLENYADDIDILATREVFENPQSIDLYSDAQVVRIAETALPVAIMRELIRNQNVSFRHTNVPNWRPFAERYRDALI